MQRIALLGLGIMGAGMANNLLTAGYPLTVYNRSAERAAPLVERGAQLAPTAHAAAAAAAIIISMVSDDEASRAVWLGPDGALAGAQPGALVVESSTLTPAWVAELAAAAAARGLRFLDAPVAGSKPQVEAGELVYFVGGAAADLAAVQPVLDVLGRRTVHLGPTGSGAMFKLVNNLLVGVQIAALAEGLALAAAAGLDMAEVVPLIINGAPGSPAVKGKAARMVAHDYAPHFATQLMDKDLRYALATAARLGVAMPTVAVAQERYAAALAAGYADQDFCAVAAVSSDRA